MALKPVKVSQLNSYIKRVLQTDPIMGNVSVIGEISNLKFHGSGHVYFSLKDEASKISCFLPADKADRISFQLEEGLEVICYGYIYLYERGGTYSINIRDLDISGQGDLAAAFEKLKTKLEKEGLFKASNKKPIPLFPKRIAIITSESGAAVRDIIKTIKRKNDIVDILIYPVLVQGPQAAKEIASAIDDINASFTDIDTIITGRGGGSMEELWAFNEEIVARSIFASKIPVISAVGHETDFTIADFVADLRAETPTAAAERAVPDTEELRLYISQLRDDLKGNLNMCLERNENRLKLLNPDLCRNELSARIVMDQMRIENLLEEARTVLQRMVDDRKHQSEVLYEVLATLNPRAVLKRGYSVVTDSKGAIIKNASQLKEGEIVKIELGEGAAKAVISESGKDL